MSALDDTLMSVSSLYQCSRDAIGVVIQTTAYFIVILLKLCGVSLETPNDGFVKSAVFVNVQSKATILTS